MLLVAGAAGDLLGFKLDCITGNISNHPKSTFHNGAQKGLLIPKH
jgi:hypothetical protein